MALTDSTVLRRARLLVAALCLTSAASFAADVQVKLSGSEEVPPVTTSATGSGTITIKDDGTVSGSITTKGVEAIAAHIHLGAPGKNGPPVVTLVKADSNTWNVPEGAKLTAEQLASFKAGELYVNVHSAAHKPGEIRGQLVP